MRWLLVLATLAAPCSRAERVPSQSPRRAPTEQPQSEPILPPLPAPFTYATCDLVALVPAPPRLEPASAEVQRAVERRVAELAAVDGKGGSFEPATREIRALGAPAVTALVGILERKGCASRQRQRVEFCNGGGRYDAPCCANRIWAAKVLGRLGEDAAGAVPALSAAVKGKPCNLNVPLGVVTCDSPLTNLLPRAASTALAEMGPYGALALVEGDAHALVDQFNGLMPPSAVPFLLQRLPAAEDPSSTLEALAAVRPVPVEAIPALLQVLQGAHRDLAIDALKEYGPLAFDAAQPLAAVLSAPVLPGEYDTPTLEALQALKALGPSASPAVPALIAFTRRALGDPRTINRASDAIDALGAIGRGAEDSLSLIVSLLEHEDFRIAAPRALGRLGPAALPYVDRIPRTTWAWFDAMADLGPLAPDVVVPKLLAALGEKDLQSQAYATSALAEIGPAASQAVPALLALLAPGDRDLLAEAAADDCPDYLHGECRSDVTANAIEALGKIGRRGDALVPRLIDLAKRPLPNSAPRQAHQVRSAAVEALGGFPDHVEQSVPVLIALARDDGSAVDALGRLGRPARAVIPVLRELANEGSEGAKDALARVETPAAGTPEQWRDTTFLSQVLRGDDESLRRRARLAVRELMQARLQCPSALRRGDQ